MYALTLYRLVHTFRHSLLEVLYNAIFIKEPTGMTLSVAEKFAVQPENSMYST